MFTVTDAPTPVEFYHNGNCNAPGRYANGRPKPPPVEQRRVIAWDMEGMNLSGDNKPQHAVIFGNSEGHEPLTGRDLTTVDMLRYIVDVGKRYPHAIHVGFGFRYDANMILRQLPVGMIEKLWTDGHCRFRINTATYNLGWIPGKTFTITEYPAHVHRNAPHTTVKIYDYSSFFGGSGFLAVAEQLLRDTLSPEDRETIAHGKAERGSVGWDRLPDVLHYWRREILLIRRTFERFRDVMCRAGFPLAEWYGPGALANFINHSRGIRPHLGAAQITSGVMPDEVHHASKIAFSGGRFELFNAGRHEGPVYAVDINSAYPHALTMIPSLNPDCGEWRHVDRPTGIKRFGFYRVTFRATNPAFFEFRPMPLFWRDHRGMITYPPMVTGWYASPEARMVAGMPGAIIHEGWYWDSAESERPWEFLHDMYATRQRLGKANLLSLPFKLGPNSLYGKYAQTVGWDEKAGLPPKSHALPIAAWVTSYCRSMLWDIIRQIPGRVIAVETDSVFTTADPAQLRITLGDGLGEWSATEYEELVYLQSGMYHSKAGGEWSGTKSRGLHKAEYTVDMARDYLRSLVPGRPWEPLTLTTRPRFIGAGAALASDAPFRTQHCVWRAGTREVQFGDVGKRRHSSAVCAACRAAQTPWDAPHRLSIVSASDGTVPSFPRRLPWEEPQTAEVAELRAKLTLERELIPT